MEQARRWIREASSIAVLTGAGVSAESGVPTFRGAGGLWNQYRAEQLATPGAFERDPRLVWEWYEWRRGVLRKAEPNAGHVALARLERTKSRFTLITQNVDSLHELAGSRNVVKLHGDLCIDRCTVCRSETRWSGDPRPLPPHCGACGGLLRPGVVWFGEALPPEAWERAGQAACAADVFLVVGTSAVVYPAAGLVPLAKSSGARVIECNMEETPFSSEVDRSLRGKAGEILPRLIS